MVHLVIADTPSLHLALRPSDSFEYTWVNAGYCAPQTCNIGDDTPTPGNKSCQCRLEKTNMIFLTHTLKVPDIKLHSIVWGGLDDGDLVEVEGGSRVWR